MLIIPDNGTANSTDSTFQFGLVNTTSGAGLAAEVDVGPANLLWVPYVVLTLILLGLLVASFIHFHYKYRDRYIKRSQIARNGSDVDLPADTVEVNIVESIYNGHYTNYALARSGTLMSLSSAGQLASYHVRPNRPPNRTRSTRLKMLYGNKVDVDRVIEKSMWERSASREHDVTAFGGRRDSTSTALSDRDELDYLNESKFPLIKPPLGQLWSTEVREWPWRHQTSDNRC